MVQNLKSKLDLPLTTVLYCSQGTHLFTFGERDSPCDYWTIYFLTGGILRSVTLWLVKDPLLLEGTLAAFGVTTGVGRHASEILGPVFERLEAVLLQSKARNPRLIGGFVRGASADMVILFHIHRGAIRHSELPDEFKRSVLLLPAAKSNTIDTARLAYE